MLGICGSDWPETEDVYAKSPPSPQIPWLTEVNHLKSGLGLKHHPTAFSTLVHLISDLNPGWLEAGHIILQTLDTLSALANQAVEKYKVSWLSGPASSHWSI